MDARIPLAEHTKLRFRNREGGAVVYTIVKEISRGGSCIVYDAFYETNSGDRKHIRLKECYPGKLRIRRTTDGCLEPVAEDRQAFHRAREKFRSDFRLGNGLFYAEGLFDALTYTMDIYDGNGTVYLVSAYSPESTLASFRPGDLATCVTLVKQVAQILKRIHREGYLYLDIKPENVLVANSYTTRVQLFDFDSLIPLSLTTGSPAQDFGNLRLSYSRGFAAIELQTARLRKLGPHTDVYGVGALLFFLLFGTTPAAADCEETAVFDYRKLVYTSDHSDRLYFALTEFFHNALANFCLDRYQDMQQVIDALTEIETLADSVRPYVRSTPVAGPPLLVGRDRELALVEQWYESDAPCLVVTGMGGMGKSTLVRGFLSRKRHAIDTLLYLSYQKSIPYTLADDRFAGISTVSWNASETLRDYYSRKLTAFRNILSGTRAVLVLDDYDGLPDRDLRELLSVGWKVILISRRVFPACGYTHLPLGPIRQSQARRSLFAGTLGRELTAGELPFVDAMIAGVAGHTLVLTLLARQIGESCLTVEEGAKLVRQHGFSAMAPERVTLEKDYQVHHATVRDVITALFRADGLTDTMQSLLKLLSLLPGGVEIPLLSRLLELETKDELNTLAAGGWLLTGGRRVDMHPVIRETVHTWPWPTQALDWGRRLLTGLTDLLRDPAQTDPPLKITEPVTGEASWEQPGLKRWFDRLFGKPDGPGGDAHSRKAPPDHRQKQAVYLQLAQAVGERCRREPVFYREPAYPELLFAALRNTPRYREADLLEWGEALLEHPDCRNGIALMQVYRCVLDVYKEQDAFSQAQLRLTQAEETAKRSKDPFVLALYYDLAAGFWDEVLGGAYRTQDVRESQLLSNMLSAMDKTEKYARRGAGPDCRLLLAETLLGKATVLIRSDPSRRRKIDSLLAQARAIVLEEAPPYARVRWIYYLVCAWYSTCIALSLEDTLGYMEKATAIREKLPSTDLDGIDDMTVPCADMLCSWQAYDLAAHLLTQGIELCERQPDVIPYMRKKAELYGYLMDVLMAWQKPDLCRSLAEQIRSYNDRCRPWGIETRLDPALLAMLEQDGVK